MKKPPLYPSLSLSLSLSPQPPHPFHLWAPKVRPEADFEAQFAVGSSSLATSTDGLWHQGRALITPLPSVSADQCPGTNFTLEKEFIFKFSGFFFGRTSAPIGAS